MAAPAIEEEIIFFPGFNFLLRPNEHILFYLSDGLRRYRNKSLFTKPFPRKTIYWAKALTVLIGVVVVGAAYLLAFFLAMAMLLNYNTTSKRKKQVLFAKKTKIF